MKKLFYLFVFCPFFISCDKEEAPGETIEVAVPITQTIAEFRASVSIEEPQEIEEPGKIYAYKNYIFVNDQMKGILVLDNTNYQPQKIAYIKIPQNTDIAIKDDILFANSGRDLVSLNISEINKIKIGERLEDVFQDYYHPEMPETSAYVDFNNLDFSNEVIIGYRTERRSVEDRGYLHWEATGALFSSDSRSSATGTGGSMARFNIAGDHLYTVGRSNLNVFDITTLSNPANIGSEYVGWQIETIFNKEGYLYLGSAVGMYIYSLEEPAAPQFMSHIQHVMGCDPVVVENDIAYVTIRGGNMCGQNENQLEVIDVSDKANPELIKIYQMDSPYGVGVKDGKLFVCDGNSGLKIYDASDSSNLVLTDHFSELEAYDVIPMENVLMMIGGNVLTQYSYKNNEITLISTFNLN